MDLVRSRHSRLESAMYFLVGVLLATLVLSVSPFIRPAHADTCHPYGAGIEASYDGQNHRGVRVNSPGVNVKIFNSNCAIVKSMYVWVSSNNFVEVGWFENPSDPNDLAVCDNHTLPHYYVYSIVGGSINCKHPTPVIIDLPRSINANVRNPDGDMRWDYTVNSADMDYYNTNISSGEVLAATERHSTNDGLAATFDGLDYMGASGNWNVWDEIHHKKDTQSWDSVTDFDYCPINNHAFSVAASC